SPKPEALVGVVGDPVAVATGDIRRGMVLVAVEVEGDLGPRAVQPHEVRVRTGTADGVLQPHPPAGAGGEAKLGYPYPVAVGLAGDGEAAARGGAACKQCLQESCLKFALDLVDEGDLVHALVGVGQSPRIE